MKNGRGPEALFRIQMFKFVGSSYRDIFLHCNVQICHSSAGACRPNCSTEDASARTRRDVALSHTVSYGPIKRREVHSDKSILSKFYLHFSVYSSIKVHVILITKTVPSYCIQ
ncbi:pancreatic secretory granule membrane major glycoprotein GP2 [Ictalurus furcatus]|uniref:pancreatic secretory granule membrane major glycoprotein GP2 n=1 Tax=Ictalurus furcatus TaxID=66913 RepID=UPI0023506BED|nr:pancreatic secretory granule membrane major glycoprotein GP2 [Ictalurus furcatus]